MNYNQNDNSLEISETISPPTNRSVVKNSQVISALVSNSVVSAESRVPLHNDCLARSVVVARLPDLDDRASVTFTSVLVRPLPVRASYNANTDIHA